MDIDNRNQLSTMSKKALDTAKILTWDNYYKKLSEIVNDIINKKQ